MPAINRSPINEDNDEDHYEVLVARQCKTDKIYDTLREYNLIPIGSAIVVQWKDGKPWTNETVVDDGNYDHNSWSHRIHLTNTGSLIT